VSNRVMFSTLDPLYWKIGDIYKVSVIFEMDTITSEVLLCLTKIETASITDSSNNENNILTFDILNCNKAIGTEYTGGVLNSTNVANFQIRKMAKPCINDVETFELYWKPPLSVFDLKHAIPCASSKTQVSLTPYPEDVWQKRAIVSKNGDAIHGDGKDYTLEILDIKLYLLVCDSNPIKDNFSFMLDLNEVHCQKVQITSQSEQKSLDVKESTNGIVLALQDEDTGNNSLYSPSIFKVRDNIEMKLNRYYMRYAGLQVPQPDFDGEIGDAIDTLKGLYTRSLLYSGSVMNNESSETLDEFRKRGMYIYHPIPKTNSDRSTRVYIQTNFKDNVIGDKSISGQGEPKLLVFEFYKKVVLMEVQNGRLVRATPIDK